MKNHLARGLGILLLFCSSVDAQTLTIDHGPVACAVADKFPRLSASFAPVDSVATAKVVFQGQSDAWYSVTMKPEGSVFVGVLPKPKKSLKSFRYYVEVTSKTMGTNRTPEYTSAVVDSAGSCQGKITAGTLSSASVIVGGPAGVAPLPVGFAPTGVVAGSTAGAAAGVAGAAAAGGGGASTAVIVGVVAGVGAVGAGVAVAAGGNDGSSTSSAAPTASPTPAPLPPPIVTGTWIGRAPDGWTTLESRSNCGKDVHDLDLVLTQNGSGMAGTMKWTTRESFNPADVGRTNSISVTGTVSGNTVTFPLSGSSDGITYVASATFTSTRMTGAVTGNSCGAMPFAVNKQ